MLPLQQLDRERRETEIANGGSQAMVDTGTVVSPGLAPSRERAPSVPPPKPAYLLRAIMQPPSPPAMELSVQQTNSFSSSAGLQRSAPAAETSSRRDYRSIERDVGGNATGDAKAPDLRPSQGRGRRFAKGFRRCRYVQHASCSDHLGFFCALSVLAYLGILTRIYLTELAVWNGLPLFPAFYSEVVGTAVMGFVLSHKRLLEKRHALTYQALATGFCGSLTTFSSWNNDAATVLIQYGEEDPDNITRLIGWATILVVGFGMPIAALKFGEHVGHLSPWSDQKNTNREYHFPRKLVKLLEMATYVSLWVATTSVVIIIPLMLFRRHDFVFSFVLASLGAYIRWHFSPLNALFKNFKLGTFLVNVIGTWVLATAYILDHHHEEQTGLEIKGLLYGATNGLCGCLTTVSTFAVELTSLPLGWNYLYGVSSVLAAQAGLLLIRGTYWWTR